MQGTNFFLVGIIKKKKIKVMEHAAVISHGFKVFRELQGRSTGRSAQRPPPPPSLLQAGGGGVLGASYYNMDAAFNINSWPDGAPHIHTVVFYYRGPRIP